MKNNKLDIEPDLFDYIDTLDSKDDSDNIENLDIIINLFKNSSISDLSENINKFFLRTDPTPQRLVRQRSGPERPRPRQRSVGGGLACVGDRNTSIAHATVGSPPQQLRTLLRPGRHQVGLTRDVVSLRPMKVRPPRRVLFPIGHQVRGSCDQTGPCHHCGQIRTTSC